MNNPSFLTSDFLSSQLIAMEADDLTTEVENEVKSVVGGNSEVGRANPTPKEVDDIGKVDDIFDTQKDDAGDANASADPNATDPPTEENNPDTPPTGGESPPAELPDSQDNQPSKDDPEFGDKNRIRDNAVRLYSITSGEIELLVNSLNDTNNIDNIQVINLVLNRLRNLKEYLYKMITTEITDLSYDELLRKYITLREVYTICTEMIEKHFEKSDKKIK